MLSVPAFECLWNEHDIDVGHKRRYTKASLSHLLESNGFRVVEMKYFFISIMPLLLLRAYLKPAKPNHIPKGENIEPINPITNALLKCICSVENMLIPYMPNIFGGSLLCVAQKI